jgi:UDP-N-acetylglucosamine 2-epimerase (non-hydrolysing)
VQEECAIFRVPSVTIRDVTERPETLECGSNILAGVDPEMICNSVELAIGSQRNSDVPPEYLIENVSDRVIKIVLGYLRGR